MQRQKLVVANWKMNHGITETIKFITEFQRHTLPDNVEVVICPPFTSLYTLSVALDEGSPIKLGAQNCHFETSGAYTGEISLEFLKETNCTFVILGHSERRQYFHETGPELAKKVDHVLKNRMTPIYCVGETDAQREAGQTFDVLSEQLETGMGHLDKDQLIDMVFAYEPVWAIGTGKTATVGIAQEAHAFIRNWIAKKFGTSYAQQPRILYGGSVKPDNAHSLMAQKDIDGALVGGASLKANDFAEIISVSR